ncbi:MAG: nucleotidyltransferase domain-containing protein, partial [Nitrospirae bacterium]|nr:nucleotidyltransferase domain-containing protein [Nitrospirota bacterium]
MPLRESEKKALMELKKILEEVYGLLDFRIFGSKARGEDSLESDIDLMIELSEVSPKIESEIDKIIFSINLRYDCFISAVIFSKIELEEGPNRDGMDLILTADETGLAISKINCQLEFVSRSRASQTYS